MNRAAPEGYVAKEGCPVPRQPASTAECPVRALHDDFVFAEERHAALVTALGLPEGTAGWGYRYLAGDMADYEGPALLAVKPV